MKNKRIYCCGGGGQEWSIDKVPQNDLKNDNKKSESKDKEIKK